MGFGAGVRGAQQGTAGPGQCLHHRSLGRGLTQHPDLVDLCGRDFGVQLLESFAVVLLEPGAQLFTQAG